MALLKKKNETVKKVSESKDQKETKENTSTNDSAKSAKSSKSSNGSAIDSWLYQPALLVLAAFISVTAAVDFLFFQQVENQQKAKNNTSRGRHLCSAN